VLLQAERLTDAALDMVAHVRPRRVSARHQQPEAGLAAFPPAKVEGVSIESASRASLQQALEVRLLPKPASRAQPEGLAVRG